MKSHIYKENQNLRTRKYIRSPLVSQPPAISRQQRRTTALNKNFNPIIDNEVSSKPIETFILNIGSIIENCPTIANGVLVSDAERLFAAKACLGIVILNDNKPVGLLMKNRLYYQLGTHYGVSLYYSRPVEKVMDHNPLIVNACLPLEAVSKLVMERNEANQYDLIIVVQDEKYLGTVSISNLLKHLTDLQIRRAFNSSPLTGLPGNLLIEDQLKNLINQKTGIYAVIYLDLDHFKAFNDYYGFEHGDRVLKQTAAILSECLATSSSPNATDFLGHIGGDDFVIITRWEAAESICVSIIEKFDNAIQQLYTSKDLAKGYIKIKNRKGIMEKFSIMSISIAIVTNRYRQFNNYLEIGEIAAELKKKAKNISGSVWITDNRNDRRS
jgi:diguanylate cyclase (GGDEF)-like protein